MKKTYLHIALLCLLSLIFTSRSMAQSWVPVGGAPGISPGATGSTYMTLDTAGLPWVIFRDIAGPVSARVMKYTGSNWITVGGSGFSASEADGYKWLTIDKHNTAYAAYMDYSVNKATVMKFNGSSWVTVGIAGFSEGIVYSPSIAVDTAGTPYVVYGDWVYDYKVTVMKFNGSSWENVGVPGFTPGPTGGQPSIAINRSGTPYVSFLSQSALGAKANVMKYDGSTWVSVGSTDFSLGYAPFLSLAIDSSGTPYVAYSDAGYMGRICVKRFNGTDWMGVGTAAFSAAEAQYISLALDAHGVPYVSYVDGSSTASPITVKKFNGTSWVTVGSAGFSAGGTTYTSVAVDKAGTPYAAYADNAYGDKATVMKLGVASIAGADTVCVAGTTMLSDATTGGTWSSSNSTVATVSTTGMVTALRSGTTIVTYAVPGYAATDTVVIDSLPNPGVITGPSSLCADSAINLAESVPGGNWASSNTAIAYVNTSGVVNGVAAGSVIVTYSVGNNCGATAATINIAIDSCVPAGVVNAVGSTKGIKVFPNPAHDLFTIHISSGYQQCATVIITDMLGAKVKECSIATNEDVIIKLDEPAGIYTIMAVTQKETLIARVIKD